MQEDVDRFYSMPPLPEYGEGGMSLERRASVPHQAPDVETSSDTQEDTAVDLASDEDYVTLA